MTLPLGILGAQVKDNRRDIVFRARRCFFARSLFAEPPAFLEPFRSRPTYDEGIKPRFFAQGGAFTFFLNPSLSSAAKL
jgi:hypothetical protein